MAKKGIEDMMFLQSLSSQNFIAVNKTLIKVFGLASAVYFSELCGYYMYFAQNDTLDEDDMFYLTRERVEEHTTLSPFQQRECEEALLKSGVLCMALKGMPARNWYGIDAMKLKELIMGTLSTDRTQIEDENCTGEAFRPDVKKLDNKMLRNLTTRCEETSQQDVKKLDNKMSRNLTTSLLYNKKILNNNEQTEPHTSSSVTEEDTYEDVLSVSEEPKAQRKRRTSKFVPPTLEEVEAYCRQRNNSVNAKEFLDYYTDGDWIDSTGKPVRNWKQKVITWEGDRTKSKPRSTSPQETVDTGEPVTISKVFVKAVDALGLQWSPSIYPSLAVPTRALGKWRRDAIADPTFCKRNPDLGYGLLTEPLSFWKSYLEFVHDIIGPGSSPKPGHFRPGSPTHIAWCREMDMKEDTLPCIS